MDALQIPFFIDTSPAARDRRHAEALVRRLLDGAVVLIVAMFLAGILFSIVVQPGNASFADLMDPSSLIARLFWWSMLGSAFLIYRFSVEEPSLQPLTIAAWKAMDATVVHGPFHLLRTLLKEPEIIIFLLRAEVPLPEFVAMVDRALADEADEGNFNAIFAGAKGQAQSIGRRQIGLAELFAGVLAQEAVANAVNAWPEANTNLRQAIRWQERLAALRTRARCYRKRAGWLPKGPMNVTMTSTATPLLDLVSRDLTESAKRGGFQPLLGRDAEFQNLWNMIEGHQRHVIVVGHPGVGKSSFFQELAQRIVEGRVPQLLSDQRVLSVDPGRLLAGVNRPGELELRFQRLIGEVSRARNVILLFEEIEQWIGMGTGDHSLDVIDELLRTIERSSLVVFATTSLSEWTQRLEKKSGFVAVFHRFDMEELSKEEAQEVLEAEAAMQESQVQLLVTVPALREAIATSVRLIHDRYLPEKALQVLNEAVGAVPGDQKPIPLCTKEVVDSVVGRMTHVPIGQVGNAEKELLLHLEDRLATQVVGQTQAIQAVANALRRSRAQVEQRARPIANLLFVGPTGVGKTLIARTVAQTLLGNAMKMIRLDMSEYQQPQSIDRMLGVPGSGTGGIVTEQLRNFPYSLLLLDELEKAHPKILTVLLQLMDEGRITDVTGRTIDATNMLLIATSNAATPFITQSFQEGQTLDAIRKELLGKILPTLFPPEFINRFDDVIIFEPLKADQIEQIASLELGKIQNALHEKGIEVEFPDATIRWISSLGYNQQYGARPLRRAIQDAIENTLARAMLEGTVHTGSKIRMLPSGVIEPLA